MSNEDLADKPVDQEDQQNLLGVEVLDRVFGGREALVAHMVVNRGVNHAVPEIQALAERLHLVDLSGFGDER